GFFVPDCFGCPDIASVFKPSKDNFFLAPIDQVIGFPHDEVLARIVLIPSRSPFASAFSMEIRSDAHVLISLGGADDVGVANAAVPFGVIILEDRFIIIEFFPVQTVLAVAKED